MGGQPLRRPRGTVRRGTGNGALPQVPRRLSPGYRAGFIPHRRLRHTPDGDPEVGGRPRNEPLSPHRRAGRFPGVQAVQDGGSGLALGHPALLEDMGVEVVDERPHEVKPQGSAPIWIYDFGLVHGPTASFRPRRSRRSSRTPSPGRGRGPSRTTASTASSWAPA